MKAQSVYPKFGSVTEISRPDFVTEVTEASRTHFVVVHLFQSGLVPCQLVSRALRDFAVRHPSIKFVEIVSTRCIEKYPEHLLPTILVYRDANVYSQITVATPEKLRQTLDIIQQHLDGQQENEQ